MRTAVAADEPEPERPPVGIALTDTNYAAGAAGTGLVRYIFNTTTAQPWQVQQPFTPQPWCCPSCGTWMAPTVAEHRCP